MRSLPGYRELFLTPIFGTEWRSNIRNLVRITVPVSTISGTPFLELFPSQRNRMG